MGRGPSNPVIPRRPALFSLHPCAPSATVTEMIDISSIDERQLRTEAINGKLSVEQLLDIIEEQRQTIRRLEATIKRLTKRLAHYELEGRHETNGRVADSERSSTSYSLDAESKR